MITKTNWPKISIITPNFNGGKYLEQTINSIVSQQYPNLEYFIIDGGSTDESLSIIKKYDHEITKWISEEDTGQSEAINKGLKMASGELCNWINSDDLLEPRALFLIAEEYMKIKSQAVIGNCLHFKEHTENVVGETSAFLSKSSELSLVYFDMGQPAHFYELAIVRELGYLNEAMNYSFDLDLWFRYVSKYGIRNVHKIDIPIARFRLHETSKTTMDSQKFEIENNYVFQNLLRSLKVSENIVDLFSNPLPELTEEWDVDSLNADHFMYLFSTKWFNFYYLANKIPEALLIGKQMLKFKFNLIISIKVLLLKINIRLPGIRNRGSKILSQ